MEEELDVPEDHIIGRLYMYLKEGEAGRLNVETCPHAAGTLPAFMYMLGWVQQDLRIMNCRADEEYYKSQVAVDARLKKYLETSENP